MRLFKRALIAGALFCAAIFFNSAAIAACRTTGPACSISIDAPKKFLDNSIAGITIRDALGLLKKGFASSSVRLNNPEAKIHIVISAAGLKNSPPDSFEKGKAYQYLRYPDHEYKWVSFRRRERIYLVLRSPSFQGLSFGLYGLLQEKLGFKFYHPKRTIIPFYRQWPLPDGFQFRALPRFDKKGFHIHSLHPIELTDQLHDPDAPHASADLREYINWLARNQQNMVEFYLLRDIDHTRWIRHAADFVSYAHERGILAGVEFSMFAVQQKAFQGIRLLSLPSDYKRQVDRTLSWIMQAGWDFTTIDFSMGEYLPDVGTLVPDLKDYVIRQVAGRYKTKVMIPTHVIRGQSSGKAPEIADPKSPGAGILIHTVMFYSLGDPVATVYGNYNLQHMLDRAMLENKRQETWYWPESAYWVCFDNSIPLLLLPYLDARWSDMRTLKKIGIDNHLTFSSGWEWGYWLVDWSIARWSWSYSGKGSIRKTRPDSPLSVLYDLFHDPAIYSLFDKALKIQNRYLKERGLIAFMSALDPSAELPWPFNKPFQPRPFFSNSWLLYAASDAEAEQVSLPVIAGLESYAGEMNAVIKALKKETGRICCRTVHGPSDIAVISAELTRALEITALRARHRSLTVRALIAQRKGHWWSPVNADASRLLDEAASVRRVALVLVHRQEAIYRYPLELIARPRNDLTAYSFGYLYPASDLFFWRREEEQVRHRRFDAFFMNIWDFRRILGIESIYSAAS